MSSFIVEWSDTLPSPSLAPKHSCCMYFTGNVWCNLIRWQSENSESNPGSLPRNSVTRSLMIMTCRIGRYYLWIPSQRGDNDMKAFYMEALYINCFDYLFHLHYMNFKSTLPLGRNEANLRLIGTNAWQLPIRLLPCAVEASALPPGPPGQWNS